MYQEMHNQNFQVKTGLTEQVAHHPYRQEICRKLRGFAEMHEAESVFGESQLGPNFLESQSRTFSILK